MEYLRRLFCRSQERQGSSELPSSIIGKIPLDILLYIVDYLLPVLESAVAFALTCKHFKNLLGSQCFQNLSSSEKDTIALLNLLAFDLPNYIACSTCGRLHSMENLRRYICTTYSSDSTIPQYDSFRLPACVNQDQNRNAYAVSNLFGTTAFKMAMKRYHLQPECTKLLDIMSGKAPKMNANEEYVRQYREECCIVQGRLLHRLQIVYVSIMYRSSACTYLKRNPPAETICPHLNLKTCVQGSHLKAMRYQKCCTEYQINFKYYEECGWAMFLSRWKDLGPGPDSEAWKQHLPPTPGASLRNIFVRPLGARKSVDFQIREETWPQDIEISAFFGDGDAVKFDSWWTSRDRAALFQFQKQHWIITK